MATEEKFAEQFLFSLNTINMVRRLVEIWGMSRRDKFFKDIGLWRKWGTVREWSQPYAISEIFHHVRSRRPNMLADIVREAVRTEWHDQLRWERQFSKELKQKSLYELFEMRHRSLVQSFKADGFKLIDGELTPVSLDETREERQELSSLMEAYDMAGVYRYYDQALQNYWLSNWEAVNSQLRTFLEALCNEIARKLYPDDSIAKESGGAHRQLLEDKGFIEPERGEHLRALFKLLNTKGAHPGFSSEDDCRYRANVVLQEARFLLSRLRE